MGMASAAVRPVEMGHRGRRGDGRLVLSGWGPSVEPRTGCAVRPGVTQTVRDRIARGSTTVSPRLAAVRAMVTLRPMVRRVIWMFVASGLLTASACARTRPYQREDLARKEMAPDPDPDEAALQQHLYGTREGAVGGSGGGGGGCGCN
jgi:hypothetical protein